MATSRELGEKGGEGGWACFCFSSFLETLKTMQGREGDSTWKSTSYPFWCPEFNPWDPHGRRMEWRRMLPISRPRWAAWMHLHTQQKEGYVNKCHQNKQICNKGLGTHKKRWDIYNLITQESGWHLGHIISLCKELYWTYYLLLLSANDR